MNILNSLFLIILISATVNIGTAENQTIKRIFTSPKINKTLDPYNNMFDKHDNDSCKCQKSKPSSQEDHKDDKNKNYSWEQNSILYCYILTGCIVVFTGVNLVLCYYRKKKYTKSTTQTATHNAPITMESLPSLLQQVSAVTSSTQTPGRNIVNSEHQIQRSLEDPSTSQLPNTNLTMNVIVNNCTHTVQDKNGTRRQETRQQSKYIKFLRGNCW